MAKDWQIVLTSTLAIGVALIYPTTDALAQNITLDGSLGTAGTLTGPNYEIPQAVGQTVGNNLFHSFGKFNLNSNEAAIFQSANNIRNILSRVIGGSPSSIDGLIRTLGSDVNFFLINPSGIIFGENARLDVNGSFVASTANAIKFGNQGFFSATNPEVPSPLLTVNPSALFFNQLQVGRIENRSIAPAGGILFSLRVPDGRSLLLVGGDIAINGARLNAPDGRVELGGLAEPGNVNLLFDGNNLRLGFPENVTRASVSLTNQARVFVEGASGGDIAINARNIEISGGSRLFAGIGRGLGTPETVAGDIRLNATREIKVADTGSGIVNLVRPGSKGHGGNITISSGSISLSNNAEVAASTFGQGNAGSVSVRASNSVELVDASIFNNVGSSGVGNGGTININAASLSLKDSALLIASTFGQGNAGNAGNVTLTVKDAISLAGAGIFSNVQAGGVGKGGNININAASLSLQDASQLQTWVSRASGNQAAGKGNVGNVTVDVTGRVTIAGGKGRVRSGIFNVVDEGATGNGGNITISSSSISLTDDAQLSASTFGQGNAGSVSVRASDSVELVDSGILGTVEAGGMGNGGTININAASLSLKDGAQLLTSVRRASGNQAAGKGNAGNITVNVAGPVNIAGTKGGFVSGILSRVNTGATGDGGNITISSDSFSLTDDAQLSARTSGQGNAGSITITTNAFEAMTGGQLITTTSSNFDAGIITLKVRDKIILIQAKVESGLYRSASEVIREGLRLLKERDAFSEMKLAALREEIKKGVEQADQGLFSTKTIDDIKAEGRRRLLEQQQVSQ